MRAFVGIAVALAWASGPALAAEGSVTEDNKIICKRDKGLEFGSHTRAKKKCMTKGQWKEIAAHTKRELSTINNRGNNPAPIPGAR